MDNFYVAGVDVSDAKMGKGKKAPNTQKDPNLKAWGKSGPGSKTGTGKLKGGHSGKNIGSASSWDFPNAKKA